MERPSVEIAGGMIRIRWPHKHIDLTPTEAMTLLADETTRSAIRRSVLRLRGEIVQFKSAHAPEMVGALGG